MAKKNWQISAITIINIIIIISTLVNHRKPSKIFLFCFFKIQWLLNPFVVYVDMIKQKRAGSSRSRYITSNLNFFLQKHILSWSELLDLGRELPDARLDERLRRVAINHCCTVVYTSGTNRAQRGVMLSHDNLTWCSKMVNLPWHLILLSHASSWGSDYCNYY